mgnify:CR=1 FL=1
MLGVGPATQNAMSPHSAVPMGYQQPAHAEQNQQSGALMYHESATN